jgi:hypothetical protein
MKSILILYPIQPYADALVDKEELPEVKVRYAEIYQELIRKRYPDFQMICVMFSASGDLAKPDISQLWKGFSVNGSDIIGACGVTFEEHCKKRIYPKEEKILDLCPQPVEELVVTGFHLWDCVDKAAKHAYNQGINVLVDEDLTELFFFSTRGPRGIPVPKIPVSKKESLEQTRKRLEKAGSYFLENGRAERKKRPWMVQI